MEKTYIALLRGINVGGKNVIKMEKLKQCFEDLGFSDVKTYIQSGNVIFKTKDTNIQKLTKTIENQLLNTFFAQIKTAVFTANELLRIVENVPENFGSEPEKFRYDVWFLLPPLMACGLLLAPYKRSGQKLSFQNKPNADLSEFNH